MPGPLANERHEKFAHLVATGMSKTAAARQLGYQSKRASVTACGLSKQPKVAARIEELREQANRKAINDIGLSRKWVLDELMKNVEGARADKQFGASNAALQLLGQELNMFVQKSLNATLDLTSLTPGQIDQMLQQVESRLYGDDTKAIEQSRSQILELQAAPPDSPATNPPAAEPDPPIIEPIDPEITQEADDQTEDGWLQGMD